MVSFPTPIPQYLRDWLGRLNSGPWRLRLYRLILIVLAITLLYASLVSSMVLLAFIVTTAAGAIYSDDLRKTASDIWNANFYEVSV